VVLNRRLAEQETLRRRLIESKLTGEIDLADFQMMKGSIEFRRSKRSESPKIQRRQRCANSPSNKTGNLLLLQLEALSAGELNIGVPDGI
jgi:hypothetical protein